jgi:CHASE2 domain-containing sensor protein
MPLTTIIVLVSVVAIFAAFASALAWAQLHQLQMHDTAIAREATRPPKKRFFHFAA